MKIVQSSQHLCKIHQISASGAGRAAVWIVCMQSLYHERRKGSAAEAAFTFQAVASRYNPRRAGQAAQRSGLHVCNHYTANPVEIIRIQHDA